MLRRRHRRNTRPALTLVETALVLSVLLLFLFGIFEYARYVLLLQTAQNAAREGARFAVAHTGDGTTLDDVKDVVLRKMAGRSKDLSGYQVEVLNVYPATGDPVPGTQWNDAPFGGAILVRISGDYHPTLPTFLHTATAVPVRATSMMGSEAN